MDDQLVEAKTGAKEKRTLQKPKEVKILLSVCNCFSDEKLTLITARAEEIAGILNITMEELEDHAIRAMFTVEPQLVACCKQVEIAEIVLEKLNQHTPFISRPCHWFDLG